MDGDLVVGLVICLGLPALALWAVITANRGRDRRRAEERRTSWRRAQAVQVPEVIAPAHALANQSDEAEHIAWLLRELAGPDLHGVLPTDVHSRLVAHYRARLAPPAAVPEVEHTRPHRPSAPPSQPIAPTPAPRTIAGESSSAVSVNPQFLPVGTAPAPAVSATTAAPIGSPARAQRQLAPAAPAAPVAPIVPAAPRPRPWESWDSAVVLLYLGAFLVVASGLVYSSYNWSDLPGWQKVTMLFAATVGFAGGGFALLRIERVRPAAETFVGIGAFLAPMNVLAARNFLAEGGDGPILGPFATIEFGALLVTVLYGVFSFRPGGLIYRYATAAAAIVAICALPPALSGHWAWGAVLTALTTALVPDAPRRLRGRLRRFARPAVDVGLVVLPLAVVAAIAAAYLDGRVWAAPAVLAATSLTVGRFALRRNENALVWLWTGLVAATLAATLLAGERPAADWAAAAGALAALWLVLGQHGPRLLRRAPNRDVLHAEALALLAVAPVFAANDERWLLLTLIGAAGTAACATLAHLRREPALNAVAALAATGTYLSLANLLPERVTDAPHALLLAPCAIALALVGALLGRRIGSRRGRRWAAPIWAVAALDAALVTVVALNAVVGATGGRTTETLVLAGVAASFGLAAIVAARSLRLPDAFLAAAGWLELAAIAGLAALPAAFDRTLPAVVVANLALIAGAILLPIDRWTDVGPAAIPRRLATVAFFAVCGALALAIMLVITAQYVLDLDRPPTVTSHPATGWWWPYLGCFLLLAVSTVALGRRSTSFAALGLLASPNLPTKTAAAATGALGASALLGLRMAYAAVDLASETWFAALAVGGGLVVAAALIWRATTTDRFDQALAGGVTLLGAALGVPAMALMLGRTGLYALDLDDTAIEAGLPSWWWLYLAVFAGFAAGALRLGRRLGERLLAPVAAAGLLGVEALLLRASVGIPWFDPDPVYWLPITATVGALTVAAFWVLALGRLHRFDRDLAPWTTVVGLIVGAPPLTLMLIATAAHVVTLDDPPTVAAWGETGWWWVFFAWYAAVSALLLGGGSWLARRRSLSDRGLRVLTTTASVATVVTVGQGWRIGYGILPFDRLDWLALAVPLGFALAAFGVFVQRRGLPGLARVSGPFTTRVGSHLAIVGGVLAAAAQVGATLLTLLFIVDRGDRLAPHADDPAWWWRYLLLHLGVTVAAWNWGRTTRSAPAAPIAVGYGLLSLWLALRMATIDLAVWSIAGMVGAAGCYLLWTTGRGWARGTEFERAFRQAVAAAGLLLGAVSLPANLAFGVSGEIAAGIEAALFAALSLGIFMAGLRERQPRLSYGAAGGLLAAVAFGVAAAGIAPVNAGYAFAALGWAIVGGSLAMPATGLLAGQRPVWERVGYAYGALPILLGLAQDGAFKPGTTTYGRLTLAIASLAGLLLVGALTGPRGRRAIQGYAAATLGLGALLMQIAAAEPANVQAYTAPVAFYLLGLAWTRRRESRVFDILVGGGAALLMAPPFLQSFGDGGFAWALLCGAEGLLFVFAGLGIGRRVPVAAGVVAVTVVALRQSVDYVNSLPTWAIMALVGVLLLILGTLSLIARDAFLRRLEGGRDRWSDLR